MNVSRAALLGAGSALTLVGLPLMTRLVAAAEQADPFDIASLNTAIELERAGIKAYVDAAATGLLSPAVIAIAQGFIADHSAHRDALIAAVSAAGGVPSPDTVALTYPALHTQADILEFALASRIKPRRRICR